MQRNALDPLDINTNQVDPVSDENGNPMRVGLGDKARDPDKALGYPYWTAMQSNQANINYRCTANVSAKGLTQNPDEVHLNTAGQRARPQAGGRDADPATDLHLIRIAGQAV